MGILDNFEAYIDHIEKSDHTCSFEKDGDQTDTCILCAEARPEENK